MEMTAGTSSGDGRASKKHQKRRSRKLPVSVQLVLSNDDLLTEILLRLPVLSLVFFKSVSKHWLSLIKDTSFILRRSQFPNLDSPCALLLNFFVWPSSSQYKFVPLDTRIPISRSLLHHTPFPFGPEALGNAEILQSCNGLLLCRIKGTRCYTYYVYNPTINLFRRLPETHVLNVSGVPYGKLAFDPTKSPHYKVIHAELTYDVEISFNIQIQTYSLESRNWSVCGYQFNAQIFEHFKDGIYWNNAIHWLDHMPGQLLHYKLDVVNEQPVLTRIQLPVTFNRKLQFQSNLVESRGSLLLIGKDYANSQQLNIYEMRLGDSEWLVKYIVNLDDIMMPFPDIWSITESVCCIVLGEREEDSYMVILLHEKVLKYKIMSKTLSTLSEVELAPVDPCNSCYQFIPSFAGV